MKKIDDLFVRPFLEPARSLDHLKHPERWGLAVHACRVCPMKKPGWDQTAINDFSGLALVTFADGVYTIYIGQLLYLPFNPDLASQATPEEIVAGGWLVD